MNDEPFWAPLLDTILIADNQKRFRTPVLLDTGAGVCIFRTKVAEALRLDWRSGLDINIGGFGGVFKGYAADVRLVIPAANYAWDARVIFSEGMDRSPYMGVLGYNGFFEYFEVRFNGKTFRVHLK